MKLTTKQLKQIIKEELHKILSESDDYTQTIIDLANIDEESFKSAMGLLESLEGVLPQEQYESTVKTLLDIAKSKGYYQGLIDIGYLKLGADGVPLQYKFDKFFGNHIFEISDIDLWTKFGEWEGVDEALSSVGLTYALDPFAKFYLGTTAELYNRGIKEAEKIGFVNTPLSTGVETEDNEITMNFYGAHSRHALRSRWAFGRNDFAIIRVGPDIWNIDEEGMQLKKDSLGQASWHYIVNKDRGIVDRGSVGDDEVKKTILKFYPDLEKVLRQYK